MQVNKGPRLGENLTWPQRAAATNSRADWHPCDGHVWQSCWKCSSEPQSFKVTPKTSSWEKSRLAVALGTTQFCHREAYRQQNRLWKISPCLLSTSVSISVTSRSQQQGLHKQEHKNTHTGRQRCVWSLYLNSHTASRDLCCLHQRGPAGKGIDRFSKQTENPSCTQEHRGCQLKSVQPSFCFAIL